MTSWDFTLNVLCIQTGDMGDIVTTQPALRALKRQRFGRKITLLTGKAENGLATLLPEVDEVIEAVLPWTNTHQASLTDLPSLVEKIAVYRFDGGVVFSNPFHSLLSALLLYMAKISRRLASCHVNPHHLLTDWVFDAEPTTYPIQSAVHLALVGLIGAPVDNESLSVPVSAEVVMFIKGKLTALFGSVPEPLGGIQPWGKDPSVSSKHYRQVIKKIVAEPRGGVILTGLASHAHLAHQYLEINNKKVVSLIGELTIPQLIAMLSLADFVISEDGSLKTIAMALKRPVIIGY